MCKGPGVGAEGTGPGQGWEALGLKQENVTISLCLQHG